MKTNSSGDAAAPLRIGVVTTCHTAGWRQYGSRMVETFDQFWPTDIPLYFYAEDFKPDHPRPLTRELPGWLAEFKTRHAENPYAHGFVDGKYDFRWDCVRFAHKVAAITDAALTLNVNLLIWADSDIVTHAAVHTHWLLSLFPPGPYIAWLERDRHYPECGFYMLRCGHLAHRVMVDRFRQLYKSDAVFGLAQTHDSYVLQQIMCAAEQEGLIATHSLSGDAHQHRHPLINGPLGKCLDHLKGQRKALGRSQIADLVTPRSEEYWCRNR